MAYTQNQGQDVVPILKHPGARSGNRGQMQTDKLEQGPYAHVVSLHWSLLDPCLGLECEDVERQVDSYRNLQLLIFDREKLRPRFRNFCTGSKMRRTV